MVFTIKPVSLSLCVSACVYMCDCHFYPLLPATLAIMQLCVCVCVCVCGGGHLVVTKELGNWTYFFPSNSPKPYLTQCLVRTIQSKSKHALQRLHQTLRSMLWKYCHDTEMDCNKLPLRWATFCFLCILWRYTGVSKVQRNQSSPCDQ